MLNKPTTEASLLNLSSSSVIALVVSKFITITAMSKKLDILSSRDQCYKYFMVVNYKYINKS